MSDAAEEDGDDGREAQLFAGIDEAGLGPILGPMTMGFSVFRAPREASNLWRVLSPAVTRNPERDRRAVVVADSKKVFDRTERSAQRLETTALGFLALLEPRRNPLAWSDELLWGTPRSLAPDLAAVAEIPWYAGRAALPMHVDRGLLELRIERLARRLRQTGVALLDAGLAAVPASLLNRSFARTANKAETHWETAGRILRHLWTTYAAGGLRLTIDRHGGRYHYGALLARTLPEASVELVREAPALAEYRVVERGGRTAPPYEPERRRMRVTFAEKAENRSFAVALASCVAKYARETAMQQFNAYFAALQPGLRPTAGYRNDGWRWLEEAQPALERARIERRALVRER
jgi:hypothetical protein